MYCASNVQIGLKCTDWPQMYSLKCTVPQMYRLASNVQIGLKCTDLASNVLPQMYCASNVLIGLKCTDWPQMYRIGLKCTELASNVQNWPQMYCASNVQIGLKCTDWPQMYRLASNALCLKCAESVHLNPICTFEAQYI